MRVLREDDVRIYIYIYTQTRVVPCAALGRSQSDGARECSLVLQEDDMRGNRDGPLFMSPCSSRLVVAVPQALPLSPNPSLMSPT